MGDRRLIHRNAASVSPAKTEPLFPPLGDRVAWVDARKPNCKRIKVGVELKYETRSTITVVRDAALREYGNSCW
jgi:hypothetical protein